MEEIKARKDHFSITVRGKVHVFGGCSEDQQVVHSFDQQTREWNVLESVGIGEQQPDSGLQSGACASLDNHVYIYGGDDGTEFQNSLYQLDIDSLAWTKLPDGPKRMVGCRMVSYKHNLILFGGYGYHSGPTHSDAEFIVHEKSKDGRGWTNELHVFDLKTEQWSTPTVSGDVPSPCNRFSLTMVDDHRAVLFGGYGPTREISNHVYILDMEKMDWSRLNIEGQLCPGRDNHSAVCLGYGEEHPQLFVTGGLDKRKNVLDDAWILDIKAGTWKRVGILSQARCMHSATATLCPHSGLMAVTLFGGCPTWSKTENLQVINKTTVLHFKQEDSQSNDSTTKKEWTAISTEALTLTGTMESAQQAKLIKSETFVAAGSYLRGVEVLQELRVEVTNLSRSFHWKDYGLKMSIPANSLPSNVKSCILSIKVSLSGQYQFPADMKLVSPVFLITCKPHCTFAHPLSLEIEHCALPENTEHLSMARALCTQKNFPYIFEVLPGGAFSEQSSYGIIALKSFSFLSIIQKLNQRNRNQRYLFEVFYIPFGTEWVIHFVITWYSRAHITSTKNYYAAKSAQPAHLEQMLSFMPENCVSLDIPKEGIEKDKWRILPDALYPLVIKKDDVTSNALIPAHCVLRAIWTGDYRTKLPLLQKVNILGTTKETCFFHIAINPIGSPGREISQPGLTMDDHFTVTEYLRGINTQDLHRLGGALGLYYPHLRKMSPLLEELVASWLNREDNVQSASGDPSWDSLIKALRNINQPGIADKIAQGTVID